MKEEKKRLSGLWPKEGGQGSKTSAKQANLPVKTSWYCFEKREEE